MRIAVMLTIVLGGCVADPADPETSETSADLTLCPTYQHTNPSRFYGSQFDDGWVQARCMNQDISNSYSNSDVWAESSVEFGEFSGTFTGWAAYVDAAAQCMRSYADTQYYHAASEAGPWTPSQTLPAVYATAYGYPTSFNVYTNTGTIDCMARVDGFCSMFEPLSYGITRLHSWATSAGAGTPLMYGQAHINNPQAGSCN